MKDAVAHGIFTSWHPVGHILRPPDPTRRSAHAQSPESPSAPSPDGTPYRLVGIPDGLGAFDNGDGTFTVLANHELSAAAGTTRAHGAKGAFVSKWTIDKETLAVIRGEDLIQRIATWNPAGSTYDAPAPGVAVGRLCSATLAPVSAFYNAASGKTTTTDASSPTARRPARRAAPSATPCRARATASRRREAQLRERRAATGIPSGTRFTGVDLGDVRNTSGATLQSQSVATGVTGFQRPEDGAWDPTNARVFYFVTTASFDGNSRQWRLTFDDPADSAAGGTIDELLDGTEGQRMLDNLTVIDRGQLLIQEDPGNQAHLPKIWLYMPSSDRLTEIAHHDPERFAPGGSRFLTKDEESSGIVDAGDILGRGWYLADAQAHYATDAELVEGGQLLALRIPPGGE